MIIAITADGSTLASKVDPRFSRCSYFILYNTTSGQTEILENPNINALNGAGPATVQWMASRGVGKIISGEFGIKIRPLLESLNIEMVISKEPEKSIQNIIDSLK
jgi:predicted Fe-Mo cluster-binding NifX family protein